MKSREILPMFWDYMKKPIVSLDPMELSDRDLVTELSNILEVSEPEVLYIAAKKTGWENISPEKIYSDFFASYSSSKNVKLAWQLRSHLRQMYKKLVQSKDARLFK